MGRSTSVIVIILVPGHLGCLAQRGRPGLFGKQLNVANEQFIAITKQEWTCFHRALTQQVSVLHLPRAGAQAMAVTMSLSRGFCSEEVSSRRKRR